VHKSLQLMQLVTKETSGRQLLEIIVGVIGNGSQ